MLITFSTTAIASPSIFPAMIAAQAIEVGVAAQMEWKRNNQVRLKLVVLGEDRAANSKAHEAFIAAIFKNDARAIVKTARAIYRSRADYEKQTLGLTRAKA